MLHFKIKILLLCLKYFKFKKTIHVYLYFLFTSYYKLIYYEDKNFTFWNYKYGSI